MRCFCHFGGGLHSTVNAAADEDEVDHLKTGTIISCDARYMCISLYWLNLLPASPRRLLILSYTFQALEVPVLIPMSIGSHE